jgi:hypothetical protein
MNAGERSDLLSEIVATTCSKSILQVVPNGWAPVEVWSLKHSAVDENSKFEKMSRNAGNTIEFHKPSPFHPLYVRPRRFRPPYRYETGSFTRNFDGVEESVPDSTFTATIEERRKIPVAVSEFFELLNHPEYCRRDWTMDCLSDGTWCGNHANQRHSSTPKMWIGIKLSPLAFGGPPGLLWWMNDLSRTVGLGINTAGRIY